MSLRRKSRRSLTRGHGRESRKTCTSPLLHGGAPDRVADAVEGMRKVLGTNDVLAYLVMMVPRLIELHRVLKPTGSLYLHCDPTAAHYLKVALDAIFGPKNFRNEIVWRRTGAHGKVRRFSPIHDTICSSRNRMLSSGTRRNAHTCVACRGALRSRAGWSLANELLRECTHRKRRRAAGRVRTAMAWLRSDSQGPPLGDPGKAR